MLSAKFILTAFTAFIAVSAAPGAGALRRQSKLIRDLGYGLMVLDNLKSSGVWINKCATQSQDRIPFNFWTNIGILLAINSCSRSMFGAIFKLLIGCLIDNTDLELSERFSITDSTVLRLDLAERWIGGNGYGLMTIASTLPGVASGTIGALATAAAALSITTNLIAVLLIGFKAYQHWRFMDTLGVGTSAAGKVLMFLTESGIVYVIFQIINFSLSAVTTTDGTPLNDAANISTMIMIILSKYGNPHSFARPPPQQGTTVTDSIMIRSQTDNGFQESLARPTEGVLEV
ncbi:hypothetical protein C8J56DRAFT_891724 [Mycena floridula]|nr:hypothetical protein C8J56DRAFT_891724 [Mycena floridula]